MNLKNPGEVQNLILGIPLPLILMIHDHEFSFGCIEAQFIEVKPSTKFGECWYKVLLDSTHTFKSSSKTGIISKNLGVKI